MKADTTVSRDEDGDEDEISLKEKKMLNDEMVEQKMGPKGRSRDKRALVIVDVQASFLPG